MRNNVNDMVNSLKNYYIFRMVVFLCIILAYSTELHSLAAGLSEVVHAFAEYISMRAA